MVHKSRARTSSLFLMELILAILFFSITSAVCVQFFVKSHILSQNSQALTQAVNECSAVAEICKTAGSVTEAEQQMQINYPHASASEAEADSNARMFCLYYDENFQFCQENFKVYEMTVHISETDSMLLSDMKVTDTRKSSDTENSHLIYQLNTSHHIARRTAYETR